eukprot:CAMPEP_0181501366 /NCGR_PEP_ID=MMETSP1110-20121109/55754_1 /TAXON_ID=174948 /ORGANISM="Symbiodinium sp., Strain CCMP421" /LENGTH=40 /DNA_ID= /DNA_START= /DNA_END= /DNA_ORIENTATION=
MSWMLRLMTGQSAIMPSSGPMAMISGQDTIGLPNSSPRWW